jgi:hypothetical protein
MKENENIANIHHHVELPEEKKMNHRSLFTMLPFIVVFLLSCSEPTEPPKSDEPNYAPLNKGDIRQIVLHLDSSTVLMRVTSPLQRHDGVEIFGMEWSDGIQQPDTTYYMIKDGYFMSTELKPGSDTINPFWEQRLAKVHPVNGEIWQIIQGDQHPNYFKAVFLNELITLGATFKNVFAFMMTSDSLARVDTFMTVFYAENIGYIGTTLNRNFKPEISATYIKVDGKEYGKLWPPKGPSIRPTSSSLLNRRMLTKNFLMNGMQIPANDRYRTGHF